MRLRIQAIAAGVVFFVGALFEMAPHFELIEKFIPERMALMINEKVNFGLMFVGLLFMALVWFEYKIEKRKGARVGSIPSETPPIEPKMSIAVTQTANPVQKVEIYNYPPPLPQLEPPRAMEPEKPAHNVQYVGFKVISSDPFMIAALRFQNVPTGKPMGKFERPRLRVAYYVHSTGQEIADMCPIPWWDEKDGITDITVAGRYADIASYFEGKWTVNEENEPAEDFDSWHKLNSVELPAGDIRIIATLSGAYNLRVPPVTGVLTLKENGNASFVRDVL